MTQTSTITDTTAPFPNGIPTVAEHDEFIVDGPTTSTLQELDIGQLLDQQSHQFPAKAAAVSRWQNTRLTYQDLHRSSQDIARKLLQHGVRPRDRVVVLAGNSIEYTQLLFAVGAIGAIFTIINPTFTAEEVVAAVDFVDPKAIFIADRIGYRNNTNVLKDIAKVRGENSAVVQLGSACKVAENVFSWHDFLQNDLKDGEADRLEQYWGRGHPNDTLCIQFTSGTTGPRKAAMLSHRNLLNNASLVGQRLEMTRNDTVCCCSPIFHCFGLVCGILSAITHGAKVVLPSDVFIADASLQALSEEKCTVIHAVPTMFQALLDHPQAKSHRPELCLRTGIIAGSSLSPTLLSRLSEEFGLKALAYGYGMTEASCIAFLTTPSKDSLLDDHSTVGTIMPRTSAKVVDSNMQSLAPGSPGELLLFGYAVFNGYYKNEEKTVETLVADSQGRWWLRTGDLITLTADGRCKVIGRVKDMIKRGGENIFPGDIEKALEQHPDIAAAAVVGIRDTYWGEAIGVFLQRKKTEKEERRVGKKDVKVWMRKRIAPHKVPEHFFWIGEGEGVPDELPVNATGKVVKMELRAIANGLVHGNGTEVR